MSVRRSCSGAVTNHANVGSSLFTVSLTLTNGHSRPAYYGCWVPLMLGWPRRMAILWSLWQQAVAGGQVPLALVPVKF